MDMNTTMGAALPDWLTPLAWTYGLLALLSAAMIATDVWARGHRHRTVTAEITWVGAALFLGPAALVLYRRYGRKPHPGARPTDARPVVVDSLPGGTASALAHLVGVPLVIASGLTIAGTDLWVMIAVIAVVAIALLAVHERTTDGATTLTAVARATLTVVAFDIGMGGWMLLLHFNDLMPPAADVQFWFLMQIGILAGLLTGAPAVAALRRTPARLPTAA
ncbi:hypothetical protein ASG36_20565 [Geodermatophilus sp. Leaf369]|uniref:DUF4396 domain-containing protein n=1 Tax=Geodermatophilus sp. Leaf369 TaxID=1736354 RepID=UPI0006F980E7|nr:DUF4396 domain-containing protein [Geodermatophilus sp. Leaf369]KQS54502.1 hypothetical protein ASG36_20565 [Geodermatophilus sp. Leaf369]